VCGMCLMCVWWVLLVCGECVFVCESVCVW